MSLVPVVKAWTWESTEAGCEECGKAWTGRNAQACAARHHRSAGHYTWARPIGVTRYGAPPIASTSQLSLLPEEA